MIKFILGLMAVITIIDVAFILIMINYAKRIGEWY